MSRQLDDGHAAVLVHCHARHELAVALYHFLQRHRHVDDAHVVVLKKGPSDVRTMSREGTGQAFETKIVE